MSWRSRLHTPATAAMIWRYRSSEYRIRRMLAPSACSPYHPCRIHLVAPCAVSHILDHKLSNRTCGIVLPGTWDVDAIPIEATRVGRGLRQRFVEGRRWEETVLHPEATSNVDRVRGKYHQIEDFEARAAYLDELWHSLRSNGFLSHRELGEPLESVMTVGLGRDDRLVRNKGGLHRLVMAQLLAIDQVPVRVVAVHPDASRDLSGSLLTEA